MRHNKKRNTAFLYEALTKELAKCRLKGRKKRGSKVKNILRKYFSKGKVLNEDLDLYRSLYETKETYPHVAEKILHEVKSKKKKMDQKEVYKEQSRLLNDVDKKADKSIYSNFIQNYKSLATIYQVLNPEGMKTSQQMLLEEKVVGNMVRKEQKEDNNDKMQPIDKLSYLKFVEKFNEKYSGENLIKEQKELLSKYIYSMGDNETDFQIYVGRELKRLKGKLKESINSAEELQEDSEMKQKTEQVLEELKSYSKKPDLKKKQIKKIMKTQELVKEFGEDG